MNRYQQILDDFQVYFTKLIHKLAEERNIPSSEVEILMKSPAFYFVAIAPFVCDADYAEMFAYANCSILITASKIPEIFNAKPEISVEKRAILVLENMANYVKNKKAYKWFQNALIAVSISDHLKDVENDRKVNKYNPFKDESTKIKYDKIHKSLVNDLLKTNPDANNLKSSLLADGGFWKA